MSMRDAKERVEPGIHLSSLREKNLAKWTSRIAFPPHQRAQRLILPCKLDRSGDLHHPEGPLESGENPV
jgi:hypothetical protein